MKDVSQKGSHQSLLWIRAKDGKQFACAIAALRGNVKEISELWQAEKAQCMVVTLLAASERWTY
ncbi:MAG: hypothetical protein ABFS09_02925 [Thermodesulfobacteriota bacterium]